MSLSDVKFLEKLPITAVKTKTGGVPKETVIFAQKLISEKKPAVIPESKVSKLRAVGRALAKQGYKLAKYADSKDAKISYVLAEPMNEAEREAWNSKHAWKEAMKADKKQSKAGPA